MEVDDGPEVLIECRDVYKAFGEKQILKGASFKVRLLLMPVVVNAGPAKGPIQRQS
jgi:ABC-type transporter Mla maintaining outer membrane lipid asymmetry ATPase subunit MlaF